MRTTNATSNEVASEGQAFGAYVNNVLAGLGFEVEQELALVA